MEAFQSVGKYFYTLLYSIFTVFLFVLMLTIGSKYEGYWFPVVNNFQIHKLEAHGDKTWVWSSFDKVRNCEYVGISWYYKFPTPGLITIARRTLDIDPNDAQQEQDPNRPEGEHIVGPWEINMTIEEVRNHTLLSTTHRCHPFYITRSILFDSHQEKH
jgi:hypothetical protein